MSEPRKRPGVAFWTTVTVACLLPPIFYFGAYRLFVRPAPGSHVISWESGGEKVTAVERVIPTYPRLGDSSVWQILFGPAHRLDKHFRPHVWQEVVTQEASEFALPPLPPDEGERIE